MRLSQIKLCDMLKCLEPDSINNPVARVPVEKCTRTYLCPLFYCLRASKCQKLFNFAFELENLSSAGRFYNLACSPSALC